MDKVRNKLSSVLDYIKNARIALKQDPLLRCNTFIMGAGTGVTGWGLGATINSISHGEVYGAIANSAVTLISAGLTAFNGYIVNKGIKEVKATGQVTNRKEEPKQKLQEIYTYNRNSDFV